MSQYVYRVSRIKKVISLSWFRPYTAWHYPRTWAQSLGDGWTWLFKITAFIFDDFLRYPLNGGLSLSFFGVGTNGTHSWIAVRSFFFFSNVSNFSIFGILEMLDWSSENFSMEKIYKFDVGNKIAWVRLLDRLTLIHSQHSNELKRFARVDKFDRSMPGKLKPPAEMLGAIFISFSNIFWATAETISKSSA